MIIHNEYPCHWLCPRLLLLLKIQQCLSSFLAVLAGFFHLKHFFLKGKQNTEVSVIPVQVCAGSGWVMSNAMCNMKSMESFLIGYTISCIHNMYNWLNQGMWGPAPVMKLGRETMLLTRKFKVHIQDGSINVKLFEHTSILNCIIEIYVKQHDLFHKMQ